MPNQSDNLQNDQFINAANLHQSGRLDDAEISYRQIIAANPNHGDALHNLGFLLYQKENYSDASNFFKRAIAIKPDNVDFHINLGQALKAQGEKDAALKCLRRALKINPNHMGANLNMANHLIEIDDASAAEKCLKKVLRKQPDNTAALMNMGVVLTKMDKFTRAVRELEKANKAVPGQVAILDNLGVALLGDKKFEKSLECLNQAISIDPTRSGTHFNRGKTLFALNHYDDALASFEKCLALGHDKLKALSAMQEVALKAKYYEKAILYLEQIIKINPNDRASTVDLAQTLSIIGKIDQAKQVCLQSLKHDPENINAFYFLSQYYDMTSDPDFITNLERAGKSATTDDDLAFVNYAFHNVYERQGKFDQAFAALQNASDIVFKQLEGRQNNYLTLFKQISEVFTPELISRTAETAENSQSQPIFIMGMPRSGTTLTEQIIASHSNVFGAGELTTISCLDLKRGHGTTMTNTIESFYNDVKMLDENKIKQLRATYISAAPPHHEKYFTDKLPGNYNYIGLIHMLFPNAPIIHCRREAADTCLSCYRQLFTSGHEYSYDMTELGSQYQFYEKLMAFWHQLLPGRILDITYEDTITDTGSQAKKLIEHCGLEWEDECLNFHQTKRAITTASFHQVRKPIYKTSINSWRRYEKQLEPLFKALGPYAPKEYLQNKKI